MSCPKGVTVSGDVCINTINKNKCACLKLRTTFLIHVMCSLIFKVHNHERILSHWNDLLCANVISFIIRDIHTTPPKFFIARWRKVPWFNRILRRSSALVLSPHLNHFLAPLTLLNDRCNLHKSNLTRRQSAQSTASGGVSEEEYIGNRARTWLAGLRTAEPFNRETDRQVI